MNRRGSALILTVIVAMMLLVLAVTSTSLSVTRSQLSHEGRLRVETLLAAESGLALKLEEIRSSEGADLEGRVYELPGATVAVQVEDLGNDGVDDDGLNGPDDQREKGVVRLVITATSRTLGSTGRPVVRTVEAYLRSEFHPLFYKALYVGNRHGAAGYGLTLGPNDRALRGASPGGENAPEVPYRPPAPRASSTTGGTTPLAPPDGLESFHTDAGDYVLGDVYLDGDLELRGTTNVYGDVDVTGEAVGRPVTGVTTTHTDRIEPPDLAAMDYRSIADWRVAVNDPTPYVNRGGADNNTTNYVRGVDQDADGDGLGLPTFINYGPFNSAEDHFHQLHPDDFQLPNFHFGTGGTTIDFGSVAGPDGQLGTADDRRLFHVQGNLWIDTRNTTHMDFPGSRRVQITVVVEGNLFLNDELSYGADGDDAILFIAKGREDDPLTAVREDESFIDGSLPGSEPNGKYDPGETIINDEPLGAAGHGEYAGPPEGQGNVYYGELVATHGGITDGYFYAQNNAYLMPLPSVAIDSERIYGVRGFLSAGGVFDLRYRRAGDRFVNYRAEYDQRLEQGTIDLPGVPPAQGGGYAGLQVVTWRELAPGSR